LDIFYDTDKYEKYLGLPTLEYQSFAFKSIKDKVWNRLNNWKVNFLSQLGNEISLKAVIQAIPTYSMSILKLQIDICKEINGLLQIFWWRHMQKSTR
jgi:hypothetical protein